MPMQGKYYVPPSHGNRRAPPPVKDEIELIKNISDLLDTGLNDAALSAMTDLLRAGVHPDAVVAVVTSLHQHSR
jgi:hypothetical protein